MKNESKYKKASLILGMMFVILFTHLPVVYTVFYHDLTGAPTTVNGIMDLTMISSQRTIILDGKWEFYWQHLIVTDKQQYDKPDFLIRVPDYWSKYKIDEEWLPAGGVGSYRLILRGLNYTNLLRYSYPILAVHTVFSLMEY